MRTYAGPPLTLACSDVVHGGVGAGSLGDPKSSLAVLQGYLQHLVDPADRAPHADLIQLVAIVTSTSARCASLARNGEWPPGSSTGVRPSSARATSRDHSGLTTRSSWQSR